MESENWLQLRDLLFAILSAFSAKSTFLTLKLFKAEVNELGIGLP